MFGEYGCLPMIAYGKTKSSSAFKLLARSRNIDFNTSNIISKQIALYEKDVTFAISQHSDDPMYDVDDDINIDDYIEPQYLGLVNESKQYKNIIINLSPHPCAHLTYHHDLRREIGTIKVKDKLCLYIDGATADHLNYVKSDLLRVDVVKGIANCFNAIGEPVMPVQELLKKIDGDKKVWDLYANGFTQGLNQCEKPASTRKVMQFKPQNITQLSYFIAAIRPGFASNLQTFLAREKFTYGIPSLDRLLRMEGTTGKTAESSYLIYDENILRCLKFAGIPGPEAYATIKAIKKKKKDKVLAVKEKFRAGFAKYLIEHEYASQEIANDTVERAWKVIEDSASYLFCGAHSLAMGCDSAYGAYLKAYHPYEFYLTQLQLYTEKKDRDKIAALISEMKAYTGIKLSIGKFGQDNREWLVDKKNKMISQSLSSVKFISSKTATDLYVLGKKSYSYFVDLLYDILMLTNINTRQLEILIALNYFEKFKKTNALLSIMEEFYDGKNKITKTLKESTIQKRMQALRGYEDSVPNLDLDPIEILHSQNEYIGLCLSCFPKLDKSKYNNLYFVQNVDSEYGVKVNLYSVMRGTTGIVRVKKDVFQNKTIDKDKGLYMDDFMKRRRRMIRTNTVDGKPKPLGEEQLWMMKYRIIDTLRVS